MNLIINSLNFQHYVTTHLFEGLRQNKISFTVIFVINTLVININQRNIIQTQ